MTSNRSKARECILAYGYEQFGSKILTFDDKKRLD